jgi:drug/metabolite transporter (DMT)-like permease
VYRLSELGAAGAASDLTQALKCVLQAGAYAAWAAADVALLQQSSIGGPELLSFTEAALQLWPGVASGAAWAALAYSALVPGALADVLQARAQARVSAAEASVLLAAEPLWTALLGAACLGERMGARGWAGGALLLASLGLTSGAATDAAAAAIAALRTPRER